MRESSFELVTGVIAFLICHVLALVAKTYSREDIYWYAAGVGSGILASAWSRFLSLRKEETGT